LTAGHEYAVVVATSSRLMTALLGAWVSVRKNSRLYLDIRDVFVENLSVLFSPSVAFLMRAFFGFFERLAIDRADRVNLVSLGFLPYFQQRYPGREFSLFSNGVDDAFAVDDKTYLSSATAELDSRVQVLYAGNIGDGQGLQFVLPQVAKKLEGRVHFRVVGSGGRLTDLRDAIRKLDVVNVEIMAPIPRSELLEYYRSADVLFLHLNDKPAFEKVLPSKLFEYAAMGKPIWAGVAGYAAEFILSEVENSVVFPPCDIQAAIESFEMLALNHTDRSRFVQRYARKKIMDAMAQDVMDLLETEK
jgi:glycosyltransferase involved in cell wall biosynthesis